MHLAGEQTAKHTYVCSVMVDGGLPVSALEMLVVGTHVVYSTRDNGTCLFEITTAAR